MPKRAKNAPIDVNELLRLWDDQTMSVRMIARLLGCSYQRMNRLRKKLGLPSRESIINYRGENRKVADPTPEEIAERAAVVKARHLAEKLAHDPFPTERPANIRNFTHCNDCFQPAGLLS